MKSNKSLEQHIAVFGESGSGKTVLLSSFFGRTREKGFAERNRFNVVAGDLGQGRALYQNYVGMRDSRTLPEPTQFRSTAYLFTLKMAAKEPVSRDNMRIVWHDYPGDWFEKDVSGEEALRRVEGFRSLLGSDVAVLLVDAQRLIDNEGQEHAYLKSLFYNYREGFEALKDDILEDSRPLARFPRVWMIALSKADLLPDLDVRAFRDLVIGKAGADLTRLSDTIASMVEAPDALAVGDDFLLLSSARFTPDEILVTERIGVDLMLPIASMLPIERHMHWISSKQLPAKIGKELLNGADVIAGVVGGVLGFLSSRAPAKLRPVVELVAGLLSKEVVEHFTAMGREKLEQVERVALQKRQYLAAVLARFRLDLDEGEADEVLLRSLG